VSRTLKKNINKLKPRNHITKEMITNKRKTGPHTDRKKQASKDACDEFEIDEPVCADCGGPYVQGSSESCDNAFHRCRDCIYDDWGDLVDKCVACGLASDFLEDDMPTVDGEDF
jgi:hypothetical protein